MRILSELHTSGHEYQHITARLFPELVSSLVIKIRPTAYSIPVEEFELVKTATNKRINEFSAGRFCAHKLLAASGMDNGPILIGKHREPLWPAGIIGSITHSKDLAGAVLCPDDICTGIGFDIETIKPFNQAISKYICTPAEFEWLIEQKGRDSASLILLLFSIKESIFKCLFHATGYKYTFKDIQLAPDIQNNTARATLADKKDYPGLDKALTVRFHIDNQHIFSSAVLAKLP